MGITQQTLSEALRSRWARIGANFSADRRPEVPHRKAAELEAAGWGQFTNAKGDLVWYLPGKPEHEAETFAGWDLDQAYRAMAYRGQTAQALAERKAAEAEKVEASA
jgi:hypothetical protein